MGVSQLGTNLLGLVSLGFWLAMVTFAVVVAWRAMRALEGIESALRERNSR